MARPRLHGVAAGCGRTSERRLIGLNVGVGSGNFLIQGTNQAGVTAARWEPPLADGATQAPIFTPTNTGERTFNADIERDADGDGFGDETQDACPGQRGETNGCDKTPPESKIAKVKHKYVVHRRKLYIRLRFSSSEPGSSFNCKLDREVYTSCRSGKRFGIKATRRFRKHTLRVRAIDLAGNVDPTPARRSFKLKRIG